MVSVVIVDVVVCVVIVVVTVARKLGGVEETGKMDVSVMSICFDITLLLLYSTSLVVDLMYS